MDTLDCIIIVVVVLLLLLLSVCVCVCVVRFVSKQIIRFVSEVCLEMKNLVFSCQKRQIIHRQTDTKKFDPPKHIFK